MKRLLTMIVLALSLAGCPIVREGTLLVTPGVPPVSGCTYQAERCNGAMPEVCSASHRWWPSQAAPCPHGCGWGDDTHVRCMRAGPFDSDGGTTP